MVDLGGIFWLFWLFADLFLLLLFVLRKQVLFLWAVVIVFFVGLDACVGWDGLLPLYVFSWMDLDHLNRIVLFFPVLVIIIWHFFERIIWISWLSLHKIRQSSLICLLFLWICADDWIAINKDLLADFLLLMVILVIAISLVLVTSCDVVRNFVHFHDLVLIVILRNDILDCSCFEDLLLFLRHHVLLDFMSFLNLVLLSFFQLLLLHLDFNLLAWFFDRLLRTLLLVYLQDLFVEFLYAFAELLPVEGCWGATVAVHSLCVLQVTVDELLEEIYVFA